MDSAFVWYEATGITFRKMEATGTLVAPLLTGYTPPDLALQAHVNRLQINMRLPYGKIELYV